MNREVIIVLGKTGYGKSLWSNMYSSLADRFFVYDPSRTYRADYESNEYLDNPESLAYEQKVERITSLPGGLEASERGLKHFRFGTIDPDDVEAMANAAFIAGQNLFAVEETSTVFEKGERRLPDHFKRLVFFGRHRQCSLLFVAQRAMSIPIDIRSQASRIVSFQQHEGDDLSWLYEFYGKDTEIIPYLPKLQCLDYCNGSLFRYSIKERAESFLGKKLDIDPPEGYSRYWK